MNNEKQQLSEQEIRDNISNLEKLFEKTAIETVTEEAKISLEIVKNAVKSQDPKNLLKGFYHCNLIQQTMAVMGIEYSKINSSEKEIESLENEIRQKIPTPGTLIVVTGKIEEIIKEDDENDNDNAPPNIKPELN